MGDSVLVQKLKDLIRVSMSITWRLKEELLNTCETLSIDQQEKLATIFKNEQENLRSAQSNYADDQRMLANQFLIVLSSLNKI